LTDEFDFQRFKELFPNSIPLFRIDASGKLTVFTVLEPPEHFTAGSKQVVSKHLRGRFVFGESASYWGLTARFDAGAEVKATNLTDEFDFQRFKELYPNSIPLFLIDANGKLKVFTILEPLEPVPGTKIISIANPAGAS
jgi:hypothetical protein